MPIYYLAMYLQLIYSNLYLCRVTKALNNNSRVVFQTSKIIFIPEIQIFFKLLFSNPFYYNILRYKNSNNFLILYKYSKLYLIKIVASD